MKDHFGTDNITFTATTENPHAIGVTRTLTSFSAAGIENARSRLYLGVHFQWDADNGVATGIKVADDIERKLLQKVVNGGTHTTLQSCNDQGDDWTYAQQIYSAYDCRQESESQWTLVLWPWP